MYFKGTQNTFLQALAYDAIYQFIKFVGPYPYPVFPLFKLAVFIVK